MTNNRSWFSGRSSFAHALQKCVAYSWTTPPLYLFPNNLRTVIKPLFDVFHHSFCHKLPLDHFRSMSLSITHHLVDINDRSSFFWCLRNYSNPVSFVVDTLLFLQLRRLRCLSLLDLRAFGIAFPVPHLFAIRTPAGSFPGNSSRQGIRSVMFVTPRRVSRLWRPR